MVRMNPDSGAHDVTVDPQYLHKLRNYTYSNGQLVRDKTTTSTPERPLHSSVDTDGAMYGGDGAGGDVRRRRSPSISHNASESSPESPSNYDNKTVKYIEARSKGVVCHLSVEHNQTFLVVKDVRHRLLLDLPHKQHHLKVAVDTIHVFTCTPVHLCIIMCL